MLVFRVVEPEIPAPSVEDVDVTLLEYVQTLTPLERVLLNEGARELALALREAGRKLNGDTAAGPAEAAR
jgi:hypothetical protein